MKKRLILGLAGVAVMAVVSIGGYAFASGTNEVPVKNVQENVAIQEVKETQQLGRGSNHCGNQDDMIKIMEENGFGDMATWMQNGDYEAMNNYMKNLSEEDYQKMINLMEENGYENMSRMMDSIGRDGMINMHNSMMGGKRSGFNMMGRFNN